MPVIDLAVIGGTGAALPDGFVRERESHRASRYGESSAPVVLGHWQGLTVAFLARHGRDTVIAPHNVNYRANIWALAQLECQRIVALNSVGGIAANCPPLALVVPDQLIDYTWGRSTSFADVPGESARHIDFTHPYSAPLRAALVAAGDQALVDHGTYAATQGPRLETAAEIARLERDGCDIVGMTGMPEAALAREVDLPYASLCLVANWAAGKTGAPVSIDEIHANMAQMHERAWSLLARLARQL